MPRTTALVTRGRRRSGRGGVWGTQPPRDVTPYEAGSTVYANWNQVVSVRRKQTVSRLMSPALAPDSKWSVRMGNVDERSPFSTGHVDPVAVRDTFWRNPCRDAFVRRLET